MQKISISGDSIIKVIIRLTNHSPYISRKADEWLKDNDKRTVFKNEQEFREYLEHFTAEELRDFFEKILP